MRHPTFSSRESSEVPFRVVAGQVKRSIALAAVIALALGLRTAHAVSYANPGTSDAWNMQRWNNSTDGPSYTSSYTANSDVQFTTGHTYFFNGGIGSGTLNVGNVTLDDNVSVTFAGAAGTLATGGNVRTLTIGNSSANTVLNFAVQPFSTAAGTGFIKNGPGVLYMLGSTYTGGFTLNDGTMIVADANSMGGGATNSLVINGGILAPSNANYSDIRDSSAKYGAGITIGGNFQLGDVLNALNGVVATTLGSWTTSNNVSLGAATRTITLGNTGNFTFNGNITGSPGAGLVVNANANGALGVLALGGTNTYDGGTTLNGGVLRFGRKDSMPANTSITVPSGAGLAIGVGGASDFTVAATGIGTTGGFITNGDGGQGTNQVTWSPGAIFGLDTSGGSVTYNLPIGGFKTASGTTDDVGFMKLGSNTLTLSGANTYTGTTYVRGGTLKISGLNALPSTTTLVGSTGAVIDLSGNDQTVAMLSGAGTVVLGIRKLTIDSSASGTFNGNFSSGAGDGQVVKNGTGKITLTNGGLFNGEFILNSGTVGVGNDNAFGNSSTSTLTITGGKLANNATTSRTLAVRKVNIFGNFTVDGPESGLSNPGSISFDGPTAGTAIITVVGTPMINVIAPTNAASGFLVLSGVVGDNGFSGGLIKTGTGGLSLNNAANTYGGPTEIQAGELRVDADGSLGSGAGDLILNGGKLNASQSRTVTTMNPFHLNSSSAITTTATAATAQFNFGSNVVTGASGAVLTLRNDSTTATNQLQVRYFGGGFNFSNNIDMPSGPSGATAELSSFNTNNTTQTFSGTISGTGDFKRSSSTASNSGTTVLSGNNTFSGGVELNDGTIAFGSNSVGGPGAVTSGPVGTGTIRVNGTSSLNVARLSTYGGARTVDNPITFAQGAGGNRTLGITESSNLTLGGNVSLGARVATFDVIDDYQTATTTISGVISGTVGAGLILSGSGGTLKLTADNTYDGTAPIGASFGTTITSGTLLVSNTGPGSGTGIGTVSVGSGGRLGGTGRVGGDVVVDHGEIAPGEGVGTLKVSGNVTMGSNSNFHVDLSGASNDLLDITGNLDLSAFQTVSFFGSLSGPGPWIFAKYTGTLTGTFDDTDVPGALIGYRVDYSTPGQIKLVVPGDYNGDNKVDAADYVLWRKNPNTFGGDAGGYIRWRANFGVNTASGAGLAGAAVPEPSSIVLLAMVGVFRLRRRR
jgi:fibronectin-binding autotransporter adhesin